MGIKKIPCLQLMIRAAPVQNKSNYMQHIPRCPAKADRNEPNSLERPQTSDLDERTQKENIRIEFKQALDELKQASDISAQELFNLIYEKHPPSGLKIK